MKIEWQNSGGSYVTLGDDSARHTVLISAWEGQAQVQQEPLVRGANPFAASRLNVAGVFAFSATKSHATLDAAVEAFFTEYARLGQTGSLKITTTAKVITYTSVLLAGVSRGDKDGVRLEVGYQFHIFGGTIA